MLFLQTQSIIPGSPWTDEVTPEKVTLIRSCSETSVMPHDLYSNVSVDSNWVHPPRQPRG